MLTKIGRQLAGVHDKLKFNKDKCFVPLINILPGWLTANQVTILRTLVLLVWLPYAIFYPGLIQILVFLFIYFLDLLDGALARLKNKVTYFGGYLDHLSDKFSNIAILIVLYGVTGYQFNFFLFFIWWDIIMAAWLAWEGYLNNRTVFYVRVPLEFVVKVILWLFLVFEVLPIIFSTINQPVVSTPETWLYQINTNLAAPK